MDKIKVESKPVGFFDATSHGNDEWPDESTISKTETVVDSSEMEHATDWVNGFPPVGAECEWLIGTIARRGTFVGLNSLGSIVVELDGEFRCYHEHQIEFRPIQPEQTELQCEIDMINAYLEQIDSHISDYDVQMFAQYVIDRLNKDGE